MKNWIIQYLLFVGFISYLSFSVFAKNLPADEESPILNDTLGVVAIPVSTRPWDEESPILNDTPSVVAIPVSTRPWDEDHPILNDTPSVAILDLKTKECLMYGKQNEDVVFCDEEDKAYVMEKVDEEFSSLYDAVIVSPLGKNIMIMGLLWRAFEKNPARYLYSGFGASMYERGITVCDAFREKPGKLFSGISIVPLLVSFMDYITNNRFIRHIHSMNGTLWLVNFFKQFNLRVAVPFAGVFIAVYMGSYLECYKDQLPQYPDIFRAYSKWNDVLF